MLEGLFDAVSPVRRAWAHEPPVTGAVHMIRLKGAAGHEEGILYFTTLLNVVVDGEPLEHVLATTGPISLEITSAYLTQNRINDPASDGPFRPAADTTFSIAP